MTTSFHRMVSLCIPLIFCASGCHFCHHFGHGCHRCQQHDPGCGGDVCGCPATRCNDDGIQCQRCGKRRHLRPMQRLAAGVHQGSPDWFSPPSAYSCGGPDCGGCDDCRDGFYGESVAWQQGYGSPSSFAGDPMAMPMTDGWSYAGEPYAGEPTTQGGCGCNQSGNTGQAIYLQGDNGGYYGPGAESEWPPANVRPQTEAPRPSRSFPPAEQQSQDLPPQDMTPVGPMPDPLPDLPQNAPSEFEPLGEKRAAPSPSPVIDPTSYQLPRMPPIPERHHGTTPAPRTRPILHIPTTAESFRR